MDMINQLKEGVVYKHIKWGISEKELVEGYKYLIENAMVSSFDVHQLEKELPKATVTSRGKALMERENKEGSFVFIIVSPVYSNYIISQENKRYSLEYLK